MKNHTKKMWDANEIALLKFCRFRDLTANQVAEVLGRSYASVAQMWMKVQAFENGVRDQGPHLSDKIKKGLQLEFRVRNDALNIEHRQRWFDQISKVTGIQYFINPALTDLKEKKEAEGGRAEEINEETTGEVGETVSYPPLLQLTISTESVLALIKAWRG